MFNNSLDKIINKIIGGALLICVVLTCSVKSRKYGVIWKHFSQIKRKYLGDREDVSFHFWQLFQFAYVLRTRFLVLKFINTYFNIMKCLWRWNWFFTVVAFHLTIWLFTNTSINNLELLLEVKAELKAKVITMALGCDRTWCNSQINLLNWRNCTTNFPHIFLVITIHFFNVEPSVQYQVESVGLSWNLLQEVWHLQRQINI